MGRTVITNLGVDPGNGFIKAQINNTNICEPFVYADVSETYQHNNFDFIFEYDNRKLLIGAEAEASGFKIKLIYGENDLKRYNTFFYKLIYSYIIKGFCIGSNEVVIQNMVVGVPNNLYGKLRDELISDLKGKTCIVNMNKANYHITANNVKVVPQPIGTYYSDNSILNNNVYIVDIGFGSVDYTYFINGNIIENFGTNNGLRKVLSRLQKDLEELYLGINLNPHSTLAALQMGLVRYGGENKKIDQKLIDILLKSHFESIVDVIVEKHNHLASIETIIFTGGASNEFAKYIADLNLKNVKVLESSQLANVRGFSNIAKSM